MFYDGDIASGIATAMHENKCVVCFLKDDSDESKRWEADFLPDQNIPLTLASNAVTLRIESGSQEASYLSAFTPISNLPALVVIYQGKVEAQLNGGISKNDFTLRLLSAVRRQGQQQARAPVPNAEGISADIVPAAASEVDRHGSNPSQPATTDRQARIQTLLAERKQRLDAEKKARDEAEKSERAERAGHRATATEVDGSVTAQRKHAQEEKKRKLEAQVEKERVRRLVEADKEERRARQERQKALLKTDARHSSQDPEVVGSDAHPNRSGVTIQVRLLNGSSMRRVFTPEDTPREAVRKWIDESRKDGKAPYNLKIILTPYPSKAITEMEESKSLQSLGLAPSATLVLVPSKGSVASAYEMSKPGVTLFGPFFTAIFHTLAIIFGFFGHVLNTFIGNGVEAAGDNVRRHEGQDAAPGADAIATARAPKQPEGRARHNTRINVRTLRDQQQDTDEPREYYNGNQLSFEPKPTEDEEKT